jgi:hypothetical protein
MKSHSSNFFHPIFWVNIPGLGLQVLLSIDSSAARRLRGKVVFAALQGAAQRSPAATTRLAGNQGAEDGWNRDERSRSAAVS